MSRAERIHRHLRVEELEARIAPAAVVPQTMPYGQDFSSGLPGDTDGWEYYSSTPGGQIVVTNGELRMYDQQPASFTLNEAILHLDLSGASNLEFRFDHMTAGDGNHALPTPGSAWETAHYDGDGLAMSMDGVTWYTIQSLTTEPSWTTHAIDLDAAVAAAGIEYTSDFCIKFQQYDNYAWGVDGRAFDNISFTSFVPAQPIPYSQDFSSGLPGDTDGWEYYSSTAGGRILVTSGELRMYDEQPASYTLNEAVLHLDLAGESNVQFRFDHMRTNDTTHALPTAGTAWETAHYNGDGVAMSPDGVTWYTIQSLGLDNSWTAHTIDLDAAVLAAGISYTSNFRIKFQQYDNYAWGVDGRAFDNIEVRAIVVQAQAIPYTQDFSSGLPDDASGWDYYSSTAGGRVLVSNGELRMYDNGAGASLNEAILHLDLSDAENVELRFDHMRAKDGVDALPAAGTAWTGEHYNGDGVAMSADGVTWYTLESLGLDNSWTTHVIDLDAAISAAGISYTADFCIKFQQYDTYTWGVDGRAFDNISVGLSVDPQPVPYSQDFSSGVPGAANGWEYYSSTTGGRIEASASELRMYDQGAGASVNEAILHVDLSSASNIELRFDHMTAGDGNQALPAPGTAWAGPHYNGDGLAMSADGVTWYTIVSLGTEGSWTTHVIDLDAAITAAGISYTSDFCIKFQQYDSYAWGVDGRAFDNISVTPVVDVQSAPYSQDFSSGAPGAEDGWEYYSSTTGGRIDASTGELRMYDDGPGPSLNEAVLHLNLLGASNVELQFDHMRITDDLDALPAPGTAWAGEHYNGDGVAISADGVTWYTLESLGLDNSWTTHVIDLDAAVAAAGISYTSDFRIKFQQYDNYTWGVDGRAFDNIQVTVS